MANNNKKGGLFSKLTQMPERSEDYARKTLPTNRWSLGWDLFRTNFGKIVKINLLTLLFVFPLFFLFLLNAVNLSASAEEYPFSQNLGLGYPTYPGITGLAETLNYNNNITTFVYAFILVFYISIGVAGGFYVMRNMVWTEGVFVGSDFWAGVKKNYKNVLLSSLLFTVFLAITTLSINLSDIQIANNPNLTILFTILKVISYAFLVFFILVYMWMLTLNVTYELKFTKLIKNGVIFALSLLPFSLFFGALAFLVFTPLLAEMGTLFFTIGVLLTLTFGLSLFMLIWMNYSTWAFDEFVNDKVAGAKKNRGIYKKNEAVKDYTVSTTTVINKRPVKPITDYDVEIVELPTTFSRADLQRLQESKIAMIEDSDRYVEEHKNEYLEDKSAVDEFMSGEEDTNKKSKKGKKK